MTYSITQLPLYQDTFYRYTINLEGRQRTLNFYWNERDGGWHFDIKNTNGVSVLLGQKLVPLYPIAADYRLEDKDLTGYFYLAPNNLSTVVDPLDSTVIPQFFKLYYIYEIPE
ncbi:hypothetical protein D3C85_584980 [compost metagenome]